jgi:hypothetical protein
VSFPITNQPKRDIVIERGKPFAANSKNGKLKTHKNPILLYPPVFKKSWLWLLLWFLSLISFSIIISIKHFTRIVIVKESNVCWF